MSKKILSFIAIGFILGFAGQANATSKCTAEYNECGGGQASCCAGLTCQRVGTDGSECVKVSEPSRPLSH